MLVVMVSSGLGLSLCFLCLLYSINDASFSGEYVNFNEMCLTIRKYIVLVSVYHGVSTPHKCGVESVAWSEP